ncbi:putative neural-cadherin 2 [Penaeus monodon]|uniref:putative neural-cadherin 2 n=1 Tax=Penaeus monodon TaxID=6687 RepID=UPI0018A75FE3|nr:putative neural-cadherin 2 [Penaeus monodon]
MDSMHTYETDLSSISFAPQHELVVAARSEKGGSSAHSIVHVTVADVNDNEPEFLKEAMEATVMEGDRDSHRLPVAIFKVEARDVDAVDKGGLLYSISGDGVDGVSPGEAYFSIKPETGDLFQMRPLDRDPPYGKAVWKVKVQVRDGQRLPYYQMGGSRRSRMPKSGHGEGRRVPHYPHPPTDRQGGWHQVEDGADFDDFVDYMMDGPAEGRGEGEGTSRSRSGWGGTREKTRITGEGRKNKARGERRHRTRIGGEKGYKKYRTQSMKKNSKGNRRRKLPNSFLDGDGDGDGAEGMKRPKVFRHSARRKHQQMSPGIRRRLLSLEELVSSEKGRNYMEELTQSRRGDARHGSRIPSRNGTWRAVFPNEGNRVGTRSSIPVSPRREKNDLKSLKSSWPLPDDPLSPHDPRGNPRRHSRRHKRYHDLSLNDHWYMDASVSVVDSSGCQDYGVPLPGADDPAYHLPGYASEGEPITWTGGRGRVHVVEAVVTVVVKDINDNPPMFPNATLFGEVQENGPIDLSVTMVSAWDADDEAEGTNALVTYTIEKNVLDEKTGLAIFTVNPHSGLIRTAVCCLDRETTPRYVIQVTATDGGGLKGTASVVVQLADVNDNSPRLTREVWEVDVKETRGRGPPDNITLLQISTFDSDTSNYFYYRVLEDSGWGWQHFGMRTVGNIGELYALQPLDFEDPAHRRGFRFMVQVTDRGRGGWKDPRHTDTAWISITLKDINDNPPEFRRPHAHVTVREDTIPGTLLAHIPARDPDMVRIVGCVVGVVSRMVWC